MEKVKVYPPILRGADYVAAWVEMYKDGRRRLLKVVSRKGKYCCYIGVHRVCAFTYIGDSVHWLQSAVHRHSENGFRLVAYTPWGGCLDRRHLIYAGCKYCPWGFECIAREKEVVDDGCD